MSRPEPFYSRALVTFSMALSFLVLAASGLVLFVAPPGRIANWSRWSIGLLTKANWQAVHTVFSLLFVVLGAVHLYFNWRVIVNYVRTKVGAGIRRGRELAVATAAAVAVLAATLAGLPPFSTIVTFGEDLKDSWSTVASEPPVPHAEAWTLARFAENTRIPVETVTANLARHDVRVDSADITLQELARDREVTPKEIYDWALGGAKPGAAPAAGAAGAGEFVEGGGFGRRTVQQICGQSGLSVDQGLERLRAAGIAQATAESTMRELAQAAGRTPIEIAQLVRGR